MDTLTLQRFEESLARCNESRQDLASAPSHSGSRFGSMPLPRNCEKSSSSLGPR